MNNLLKDIRYAIRSLLNNRVFTLFVIFSLALGIGANTAIFTLTKAVFFRPLPVEEPQRLVSVFSKLESTPGYHFVSYLNFVDYREMNSVFSELVAYRPFSARMKANGDPLMSNGDLVSGNYFDALGVKAAHGRTFYPEEDETPGTHPVVVLSHDLWTRSFKADPDVVGETITLNDQPFTVIGVTPESFNGLHVHGRPQFYVPIMMWEQMLSGAARNVFMRRGAVAFFVVGRLKDGVSIEQADAAMATLAKTLEQEYPDHNTGLSLTLMPLTHASIHPDVRQLFNVSGGLVTIIVGILLLITCANIANMLFARSLERGREMAVRSSLGAGRGRLARQLLTEGVVMALLGGAAGVLLAYWLRNVLWTLRPPMVGDFLDVSIDLRTLGFALAVSLATGLFFGLVPLLLVNKLDLVSELKSIDTAHARGKLRGSVRDLFVVFQVTLSMVSLIGAALFMTSLKNMRDVDVGFAADELIVMEMNLGLQGYDRQRGREYYRNVLEKAGSVPGVSSAALALGLMLEGGAYRSSLSIEGRDDNAENAETVAYVDLVSEDYFKTLGIPLIHGRTFTTSDDGEAPSFVGIINEAMEKRLWPDGDAVGGRFHLDILQQNVDIVGVVKDAKYRSISQDPDLYVYLAVRQVYNSFPVLYVRTKTNPSALLENVRREVQSLDPEMPLGEVSTLSGVLEESLWAPRLGAGLLGLMALLTIVLTVAGIYGVTANAVRQRHRELGIRIALGASRIELLNLFLTRGMAVVAVGAVLGAVIAYAAGFKVAGLVFGVNLTHPLVLGGAALALLVTSLAANLMTASKSFSVDPVVELRVE